MVAGMCWGDEIEALRRRQAMAERVGGAEKVKRTLHAAGTRSNQG